jgi:hypothetical protein
MDEQVITTTQIWQLVIAFIIPIIIIKIATYLRKSVWVFSEFDKVEGGRIKRWLKQRAGILDEKWGIVILLEILAMFLYATVTLVVILGNNFLMESMVFAAAVVVFMTFQLPRLLPPNVLISFLPCDNKSFCKMTKEIDGPITTLKLTKGSPHWFSVYLANLGINNYEKMGCWISFDKSIKPMKGEELLKDYQKCGVVIDKERIPKYQEPNNCLRWEPNEKLSVAHRDTLIHTARVITPEKEGRYPLDVEINSSTRWGNTRKRLYFEIH